MIKTIFSALIGVTLITLLLIYNSKFAGTHFIASLVIILTFSLVLGLSGEIKEFNLREGRVVLREIKSITEELMEVIALNVARTGRFSGEGQIPKMKIEAKEKIERYLKKINADQARIDEILQPLNKAIEHDRKRVEGK